jgi:hypothetical protein
MAFAPGGTIFVECRDGVSGSDLTGVLAVVMEILAAHHALHSQ